MTSEEKRKYERDWYHRNKQRIKVSKKATETRYINKKRKIVIDYLMANPCIDCGETDIIVLDFDHIDPATKVKNVADLVSGGSIDSLKAEITKCEIRCANCHRRKTAKQFNLYKYGSVL